MAAASRFVGRSAAVERLTGLVDEHRLVTVTGPGGVGKTRLVTEVVADLEDRFDAGAVVAPLAFVHGAASPDEIAAAAGFESAAAACVAVGERPTLLVLDNAEHVLPGVRDLLAELLGPGADVRVVVTSREPLGLDEEHVLVVEPLALPGPEGVDAAASPAVQLFLDRAEAAGAVLPRTPEVEAAVGELCRRLDGLPLAVELAAARTRSVAPGELLELMDQRLDLLRRRQPTGDAHGSMRAAIEVSVSLLLADERAFFRSLAVFTGPFDLALAHAVAGSDDRLDTVDLLARLVDCSLVVAEPAGAGTSYRLLELLREHAHEQLVGAGQAGAVLERFVDAMVATADGIVARALDRWDAEVLTVAVAQFPNLVQACRHCIDHDATPERAFRLVLPLFAAAHNGRATEVAAIGAEVFGRWPDDAAPWRAEALAVVASGAALAGDDVAPLAEPALADAHASGIAVAVAERALGLAARGRDEQAALGHLERAATAAAEVGFGSLGREAAALAAAQLDVVGRRDEALDALAKVGAGARAVGDPVVETLVRMLRTRVLLRAGDVDGAAAELLAAEAAAAEVGVVWWSAALLRTKIAVIGHVDGWPAAARVVREAVDFAASVGALGELALTLRDAALVARRLGHDGAADALERAAPPSRAITVLPDLFPHPSSGPRPVTSGVGLVEALGRARSALDEATRPGPAPATRNELRRDGDTWLVTYGGTTARLRHLKGIDAVVTLVGRQGQEVHCLELMGGAETTTSAGPVLDDEARRQYQRRLLDLQAEIEEAEAHNDRGRAERAEREHDALVQELSAAFGLGGRARGGPSSAERARTAVAYRIRSALKKIGEVHPELARHLGHSLRTGTFCSYQPESPVEWSLTP